MSKFEYQLKCFVQMVKDRMDEVGIKYTEEQAEQMGDFVNGCVLIAREAQKDIIVNRIKEM